MTNETTNDTNSNSNEVAAPAFEQLPESKSNEVLKRIGLVLALIAVKAFIYAMMR